MVGNYLRNHRMVSRWENSLNTPPEDRNYPMCSCCGLPIYNSLFSVNKRIYCEDCAVDLNREWIDEKDEPTECVYCGCEIEDDFCFSVNEEIYCEKCFKRAFKE